MNQAEARRRIWGHLAHVARSASEYDQHSDWFDGDEPDRRRLTKACKQVAQSIERKLAKGSGKGSGP